MPNILTNKDLLGQLHGSIFEEQLYSKLVDLWERFLQQIFFWRKYEARSCTIQVFII